MALARRNGPGGTHFNAGQEWLGADSSSSFSGVSAPIRDENTNEHHDAPNYGQGVWQSERPNGIYENGHRGHSESHGRNPPDASAPQEPVPKDEQDHSAEENNVDEVSQQIDSGRKLRVEHRADSARYRAD